jgi:hypothetical protein
MALISEAKKIFRVVIERQAAHPIAEEPERLVALIEKCVRKPPSSRLTPSAERIGWIDPDG